MKTFKEILGKPSAAVRAMVEGLLELPNETFRVNMMSFGSHDGYRVCFGCAATCAVQQATGKRFDPDTISDVDTRADTLGVDNNDLDRFENAINYLRCGKLARNHTR